MTGASRAAGPAIVIVGAGDCGTRAAFTLREEGWDGPVILVGAEPSLPYERPPLSKTWQLKPSCDDAALREADITLLAGTDATGLDTTAHVLGLPGGRQLEYRSLLLATGARARRLPLRGARVHLLRTHADAVALRERLAPGTRVGVIGGGFIGLELASSAAALGCAVTVVELGPRLMGRAVPAGIAAVMAQRHVAAGIDVRCGTAVTGLAETASGVTITLAEGGSVEVDVVLAGVGAEPETTLAAAGGIEVGDGIVVDSRFATSAPDVFAAGDCCCYPHPLYDGKLLRLESWRVALEQGAAAARAMLGGTDGYAGVPWFWSDQHDLSLQVAGLTSAADHEVVRFRPDGVEIWFGLAAGGRLVAAAGVGPGNTVAKDIKLAEMLIARRAIPEAAALADPGVALKSMLRSPVATS
jgi:3-phenylpropionate/trans-cinnamate dioxygenase ferredoxin reductase component